MTTPAAPLGSRRHAEERIRVLQAMALHFRAASAGERLPTHHELTARLRTTATVMLAVLADLARAGRIRRIAGRGTFFTDTWRGDQTVLTIPGHDRRTVVALSRPDGSFFDRCLELLHPLSADRGFALVVCDVPDQVHSVRYATGAVRAAGTLVFGQGLGAVAGRLAADGLPTVVVGTPPSGRQQVPAVYSDQAAGGRLVVEHLLRTGHRRIAFLAGSGDVTTTRRWQGHVQALAAAGLGGDPRAMIITQAQLASWEAEPECIVSWLTGTTGATAVCAWNDREALRLLGVCARVHLHVPDDLAVCGYDDLPLGRTARPALTTVDQDITAQLDLALDIIHGDRPVPDRAITPALLPRASTARRVRS